MWVSFWKTTRSIAKWFMVFHHYNSLWHTAIISVIISSKPKWMSFCLHGNRQIWIRKTFPISSIEITFSLLLWRGQNTFGWIKYLLFVLINQSHNSLYPFLFHRKWKQEVLLSRATICFFFCFMVYSIFTVPLTQEVLNQINNPFKYPLFSKKA